MIKLLTLLFVTTLSGQLMAQTNFVASNYEANESIYSSLNDYFYISDAADFYMIDDEASMMKNRANSDVSSHNHFIEIYPNPAVDNFYLDIAFLKGQAGNIEIFTTKGEKLSEMSFAKDHKDTLKIKVDNLKNGDYMVCVKTKSNDLYMDHLIVQK